MPDFTPGTRVRSNRAPVSPDWVMKVDDVLPGGLVACRMKHGAVRAFRASELVRLDGLPADLHLMEEQN